MSDESANRRIAPTLAEAANEYLGSLKPGQRIAQENYIRRYVEFAGENTRTDILSGSRVESYADAQIRQSDPQAPDRVAALKAWFQFLKKRNYATQNFGVHIRVRRGGGRTASQTAQSRLEESPIELTAEGIRALQQELEHLNAQRPDIVKAISLAREDKDFRENAPLDAAREALAFNEQRRKQIEATLKRAVVVERGETERSTLGSTVTVTRLDTGKTLTYMLVGAREANASDSRISVESPVGRQLLGRKPGDEVAVAAPSGEILFRIDSVAHTR